MIRKHENAVVVFDLSGSGLENSPEYKEMLQKVQECEQLTDLLVEQYAEIDQSIQDFRDNVYAVSDTLVGFAETMFDVGSDTKDSREAGAAGIVGLAVGAAGLLVGGVGGFIANRKQKKAKEKHDREMELALEKKQEIAAEKLGPTQKFRNRFVESVASKVERLYDKEFGTTVSSDDPQLALHVRMFKRNFGLFIKAKFLVGTIDYIIAEMKAWQLGKHDSNFVKHSFRTILEAELKSWPKKLSGSDTDWDKFIRTYLECKTDVFPIGIATILSDPALFSNYVGIDLCPVKTCDTALLSSDGGVLTLPALPASRFIEKNQYYVDCRENLEENFNPPAYPKGFGADDVLFIAAPVLFAFMISFTAFTLSPGWFVRGVAILLSGVVVYYASGWYLPCEKRYQRYSTQYDEMVDKIQARELAFRKENNEVKV